MGVTYSDPRSIVFGSDIDNFPGQLRRMFHSVAKVAVKKFDPAGLKDGENILTAFNEFCASFDYAYEAQNRRPPDSEDTKEKKDAWIAQDKRRIFLGDHSSRNLQVEYEQVTTATERTNMKYADMLQKFKARFELAKNDTLTNYKFCKLTQNVNESFDAFCIRVKLEAKQCSFRKEALADKLKLKEVIDKGRSCEVSDKGLRDIKKESDINRTKPGAYSRECQNRDKFQ